MGAFRAGLPDLRATVEDQIAEGDKVATRLTFTGTHQGELMGIPPTGKQVSMRAIIVHRIENGKVAEGWGEYDRLGMLQQLGGVPQPA